MLRQILCAVIFSLCLYSSASADPALQNAGFENWTGGLPGNWTLSQNVIRGNFGSYTVSESTDSPYEGAKNAKVNSSAQGAAGAHLHETTTYLYQRVSGADPGAAYAFTFQNRTHIYYMIGLPQQGCLHGETLWAGIDPFGGTDPNSPNVIWGADARLLWDTNMFFGGETASASPSVEALAQNSDITVFVKSYFYGETGVWYGPHGTNPTYGSVGSDSYIDAAELAPVPEPSTCLILASGLAALFARACRAPRNRIR